MSARNSVAFTAISYLLLLIGAALCRAEPPAPDKALRFQLKGHTNDLSAIAFVPNSNRLLTLGYDNILRCWDMKAGTEEDRIVKVRGGSGFESIYFSNDNIQPSYYSPLAVSSDGRLAAVPSLRYSGPEILAF